MTSSPVLQNHYLRAALGSGAAYIGARLLTSRISKLASARIGLPALSVLTTGAVLLARPSPQPLHREDRTTTDGIRVVERDGVHINEGWVEIGPRQLPHLKRRPWFATYFETSLQKNLDHSPKVVHDLIWLELGGEVADVLPPLPSLKQAAGLQLYALDSEGKAIESALKKEVERLQTLATFASEVEARRALELIEGRLMEVRPYDDEETIGEWLAFAERYKLVGIKLDCIRQLIQNPEWQVPSLPSVRLPVLNPFSFFGSPRGRDVVEPWLDKIKRLETIAQAINLEIDILDLFDEENVTDPSDEIVASLGLGSFSFVQQDFSKDEAMVLVRLGATHAYVIRGKDLPNVATELNALLKQFPLRDEQRLCVVSSTPPSRFEPAEPSMPAIIEGRRDRARKVLDHATIALLCHNCSSIPSIDDLQEFAEVTDHEVRLEWSRTD